MARLIIDTGTEGNTATGDTLRGAMAKINANFLEVYDDLAGSSLGGLFTNNATNGDVKIQANGSGIVEIDQLLITDDAITSMVTNGDVTLSGNGTGTVHVNDTLTVGVNNTNATITTLGTGDLTLSTNSGTNSGTINIKDGAGGNITVEPNGTGDILLKAGGQVGIGDVSSPDTSLHIKQSTATITLQRTNDANTPGIDFQSNGGNVRAKMYMDGTDGFNKEIIFKVMDGSLDERFRVTRSGARVTGTFNINSDSDSTLGDATISMTENKITTLRSNDNLELGTNGTGTVELQADTNVTGAITATTSIANDAIKIDDHTISGLRSNDNIVIDPAGTGSVELQADTNVTGAITATTSIANDAISISDNKITTTRSNDDLNLAASGTGDINLTSTADINIPTGVGLVFGADTEKIENTSGNNMYIYAGTNIYLNAENDIHLDANGGDIALKDNNTKFGQLSQLGGKLTIYSGPSKDDEITLGGPVLCENVSVKFTSLPTSDPGVAGRLWRSGTDLKISIG